VSRYVGGLWGEDGSQGIPAHHDDSSDCLVDVGTGYGKTFRMSIPCLLDSPGTIYIVGVFLPRAWDCSNGALKEAESVSESGVQGRIGG
jgi:hypothetical protein